MKPATHSWRDAASTVAFAVALTAFVATALFVLVGLNPKSEDYGNSPWYYAGGCMLASVLMYTLSRRFDRIK